MSIRTVGAVGTIETMVKVEKNHGNVEKVTVRKQRYNYRNFGESREKSWKCRKGDSKKVEI